MRKLTVMLGVLALAACATAQTPETDAAAGTEETPAADAASAAPPPPCQDEIFRAFDFWIGEWDVYVQDDQYAGTNSIQPAEYGCLLVEHWVNAGGITGQSYNFFDPGMEKWRQVWVSAGAVIDYSGGLTESRSMLLEGEIRYHNGQTAPFTGEWTLNSDGTLTQHFRQQDTETGEWSDWFIGKYVRKDDGSEAEE